MSFLTGRSHVITRKGEIPIEEVSKGELILTHEGRWRAVIEVLTRQYEGIGVLMEWSGGDKSLWATKDQPIATPKGWLFADSIPDSAGIYSVDGIRPDENDSDLRKLITVKQRPVFSKKELDEEVYNLVVEDDGSYICNRILVHGGGSNNGRKE